MIDTDKYEGHTPAPWTNIDVEGLRFTTMMANKMLMADAPLLLEEVKRLRKQYLELRDVLVGDSPNWTHDELVEHALALVDKNN